MLVTVLVDESPGAYCLEAALSTSQSMQQHAKYNFCWWPGFFSKIAQSIKSVSLLPWPPQGSNSSLCPSCRTGIVCGVWMEESLISTRGPIMMKDEPL